MAVLITGTDTQNRASLSQLGYIPADARSIRLLGSTDFGPPVVSLNGTPIPMTQLARIGPFGDISSYGGDVTPFADSNAQLDLFASAVGARGIVAVDRIEFSASAVPEAPSTITLFVMSWIAVRKRSRTL